MKNKKSEREGLCKLAILFWTTVCEEELLNSTRKKQN